MRLDFTHAMATAYADAFEPGAAETAELARLLPTLADATLAHPYALARRLVAAGFACRDRDGSAHGFDATETSLREVLGPAVRGFARFTRHQLSFTLDEEPTVMIHDTPTSAPILPPVDSEPGPGPCAAAGLISYRIRGRYGWVSIGAVSAADAMREAARSTPTPIGPWQYHFINGAWCLVERGDAKAVRAFAAAPVYLVTCIHARTTLEVHDGAEWVPAAPDSSEGAPVSLAEFWRRYGAELAGAIEAGRLPRRGEQGATVREQAAHVVANGQRHVASDGWGILTYDGPAMKATLKAFGVWGGKVRFTRAGALAFVRGLA